MRGSVGSWTMAGLALAVSVSAQYTWFAPDGSFAVEVSLENSSYPRLPMNRNAITSLAIVGDQVLGGTTARSGLSPFVFAVSLGSRRLERLRDLAEVVPGQRAIPTGFSRAADGRLMAGTLPDRKGASGHLIAVAVPHPDSPLEVSDLGIPVPGEGVFAITVDAKRGVLYGVAHPSGRFFSKRLGDGEVTIWPGVEPSLKEVADLHRFVLEPEDYLSRRLAIDADGRVYGSKPLNRLFRFDPGDARVEVLEDELPEGWGRRALGRVDSWAIAPDGRLYAGSAADGQLFRLDPTSGRVTNLGKPTGMPRLPGLAFAADGRLYGAAGGRPGYTHLFRYDPASGGYEDLGNPRFRMLEPGMEQAIPWRAFQIGSVAASEDGRWIALGEDEALSQLLVFPVR